MYRNWHMDKQTRLGVIQQQCRQEEVGRWLAKRLSMREVYRTHATT